MQMQEASMTNNPTQVVDMPSLKLEVSLWAPFAETIHRKNEGCYLRCSLDNNLHSSYSATTWRL